MERQPSERDWQALAAHLSTVLSVSTAIVRRARVHQANGAALADVLADGTWAMFVARVSEANNWLREQAAQLGPQRLATSPASALADLFPDLRVSSPETPAASAGRAAAGKGAR